MAKFAYNNDKNASTETSAFELNCQVSFEEDVDIQSKLKSIETPRKELQDLLADCR